jgi:hypothetical protein
MVLAAFITALLSIDQVAQLFRERASLEQSYDVGHFGRFGRHVLGFLLALDQPLGIGPLQFRSYFPEDPHNAYLNAFMSGGWLAGLSYLAITVVTLASGLRFVFVATPWRPAYLAVYTAYVATAFESTVIDSDHWRHFFLLVGVLWGLMAAARYQARASQRIRPARFAPQATSPQAGTLAPAGRAVGAAMLGVGCGEMRGILR